MNDAITCSGPECDRAISRRGLCGTHYSQRRAGKSLTPILNRKDRRPASKCSGPECDRAASNVGLSMCATHAAQIKRGAQPTPIAKRVGRYALDETCSFNGCPHPPYVHRLCKRHHNQKRSGAGPLRELGPEKVKLAARDDAGNKQCATCRTWQPESAFAKSKNRPDGLQRMCRGCKADHYRQNAEKVRDKMREARFGITREQFDALFESQGNVCATCGTDNPGTSYWAVDHDHACCPGSDKTCGKCIRGILCRTCNHALGNVKDNHQTLARMIDYLAEGTIDVGSA